jgi:hypothetical protein
VKVFSVIQLTLLCGFHIEPSNKHESCQKPFPAIPELPVGCERNVSRRKTGRPSPHDRADCAK